MKARILFALSLLIPFSIIVKYVWSTAADIPLRDDIYIIRGGLIDNYCKGSLTFADLWRASGLTRMIGYHFLQILNVKWFAMNSRFIVLLIPFLMLGSAILIFRDYRRSMSLCRKPVFIAATFLLLSLLIFNVIQWEGLTFAYGFVFQSPIFFFIASFVTFELFLRKGDAKYWPATFILPTLAVLVFGGSHILSFLPAVAVTLICFIVTRRLSLTRGFWLRVLILCLFLGIITFFYLHNIEINNYFPDTSPHTATLLANPCDAVQFFLASLGASVVGVNAANAYLSFQSSVLLGFFVILFYGLATFLFLRSKMFKRTYLPFYLMSQSLFYLIFMMLGRFDFGLDYGRASRYTCVTVYGLVGIVYVLLYIANRESLKTKLRYALLVPLLVIYSGMFLTARVEWNTRQDRQNNFRHLRTVALRLDMATDKELSGFEERPAWVRQSLNILRKHGLSVYHVSGKAGQ